MTDEPSTKSPPLDVIAPQRRGRGKPPFEPTDKDRRLVKEMASCGIPQEGIARVIGISKPTLHKHFKEDLSRAEDEANFRVAQFMFGTIIGAPIQGVPPVTNEATRGALAMFWAKTRMRWKETSVHEHGGLDGSTIEMSIVRERIARRITRLSIRSPTSGDPEEPK